MKTGEIKCEDGIIRSTHICDTCGQPFDVAPAIKDDEKGYEDCLMEDCLSFDPHRDLDVIFLDDYELAKKPLVSIKMLKTRRIAREQGLDAALRK